MALAINEPLIGEKASERTKIYVDNNKNVKIMPATKYKPLITERKRLRKPLLSALDILISVTLVSPCVVGCWRGTWQLMDVYSRYFPAWETLGVSFMILLVFSLLQHDFATALGGGGASQRSCGARLATTVVTRAYCYAFAVVCVMNWRAGWALIDRHLGVRMNPFGSVVAAGSGPALLAAALALLLLASAKCINCCTAPPFVICLDRQATMFECPTRFKTKIHEQASLYILDCLFSVLIVGTLVVFVWRGGWALVDIYLFPDDFLLSSWGSLVIGYSAVTVAFLLQPLMRWICDRVTGAPRLLIADLFILFSFVGTINVWRGVWNLLNIYLLPDDLEKSCWISHWVSLVVLVLLGCSNSLLVRGVYIDAEEPAGKCVIFPCYYLRIIFQEARLNKLNRKLQEASEKNKTELDNKTNNNPLEHHNHHVICINSDINRKEEI